MRCATSSRSTPTSRADAKGQSEQRQRHWFAAAEQFPRQLHEIDLDTYLALKREDRQREGLGR